jgi:hypothetical protein
VKKIRPNFAAVLLVLIATSARAATEDMALGFLPLDAVSATLRKTLSPQGRFVILTQNGIVRVIDTPEKIRDARRVLEELQKSPAIFSIDLTLKTGLRRVTKSSSSQTPAEAVDIPIPQRFDPPRVMIGPNGRPIVIPAQPRDFTTQRVGPGVAVNVSPTGFSTNEPQVNVTRSSIEGGTARRFVGAGSFEKPALLAVSRQVADPAALRALALKVGAITEAEPAWTTAATEISITPEIARDGLVLNIVPQIIVFSGSGQPARRIPILACAAPVLAHRGIPVTIEGLPRADADFYRLFFGAADAGDETLTTLTFSTAMRYVTQAGK